VTRNFQNFKATYTFKKNELDVLVNIRITERETHVISVIPDILTDSEKEHLVRGTEFLDYPTQKPLGLLNKLITVACPPEGIILDPFCGCGTTVLAAELTGHHWIGIDITYSAIAAIQELFKRQKCLDAWNQVEIQGRPETMEEVDEKLLSKGSSLFARKEFEKFCVTAIGGLPNQEMGADGGVDGNIPLKENKVAICSVKSGSVNVRHVRELRGLLNGQKIAGVFLSREKPTRPMVKFVNQAGIYSMEKSMYSPDSFPRLQILTLEQILRGKRPDLPYRYVA
jgi:site-specific DNA-methyltransferase (adenine-specific)